MDKFLSIIKTENVEKVFYNGKIQTKVLKGIDLSIQEGEFVSIMGPSGSGKSTLLYLLGGLDHPSSGNVLLNGQAVDKMSASDISKLRRREIGFVFQFYNLVPSLTVEDNILVPVLLDKKVRKEYKEKLDEVLELIGLSEKRDMYPHELSGGQQQRVAVGRAVLFSPKIIFADEPIGNLDTKSGDTIMELFQTINKEKGTTIVQVTHSSESAEYGNRIIYLKDGEVQQ